MNDARDSVRRCGHTGARRSLKKRRAALGATTRERPGHISCGRVLGLRLNTASHLNVSMPAVKQNSAPDRDRATAQRLPLTPCSKMLILGCSGV